MPLELNRVPALLQDNLEMIVKLEGIWVFPGRTGDEDAEIVTVDTKPRIAEVRIREASSAVRSSGPNRERN